MFATIPPSISALSEVACLGGALRELHHLLLVGERYGVVALRTHVRSA